MTFSPKPVPISGNTKNIAEVMNINFQLLSKSIRDIEDNLRNLQALASKKTIKGLTETLTFNGSASGDVLTLTLVSGVITGKTTV